MKRSCTWDSWGSVPFDQEGSCYPQALGEEQEVVSALCYLPIWMKMCPVSLFFLDMWIIFGCLMLSSRFGSMMEPLLRRKRSLLGPSYLWIQMWDSYDKNIINTFNDLISLAEKNELRFPKGRKMYLNILNYIFAIYINVYNVHVEFEVPRDC